MSTQSTFYQARAAEERDKAEGSNLDNVRDGHLRAAAAWTRSPRARSRPTACALRKNFAKAKSAAPKRPPR